MPTKIRITDTTLNDEDLVKLILSFTDSPDLAIIVKEHTPKTHYHVYLEDGYTPPTIRQRLRGVCSGGNKSFSVSTNHSDWKGYKGYLFKHSDTEILHSNYDENDLKEYYISKSSKSQQYTDYTKIKNWIESRGLCNYNDPRSITKNVLKYYLEEHKIFNKAHIAQIVQTIYFEKHQDDENIISSIVELAGLESVEDCEVNHLRQENATLKKHLKNFLKTQDPE